MHVKDSASLEPGTLVACGISTLGLVDGMYHLFMIYARYALMCSRGTTHAPELLSRDFHPPLLQPCPDKAKQSGASAAQVP